jgi:tetratricopeptide (TPR) repeat protein/predicted Ser/Thr protein kinase
MEDPKPSKATPEGTGVGGSAGLNASANRESSANDIRREEEKARSVRASSASPSDSSAAEGDVTLVDSSPSPDAGKPRLSKMLPKNQLQPGDVLGGRFEILDVLGEGGMGTVYKALDREVDHFVALKLIRPELAAHPAILARFKQELLTARQVTHKNVIRIHDLSEVDGLKFITMEFVDGDDLRKLLLDNGKIPPQQAVEIIRQVCFALEAAHGAGVIHRDLKPQNIMQDKQGRILVMDFGLARSLESGGMTQTGALLGTIEYMSPEQAIGKQLDCRSDLFAVGLIFYELLTGRMPYKADTAMASLLKRNQERALPAAQLDASIPGGLSDIVSKCLERDLNMRYQSAQEILADLDAWQGKRPILASVASTAGVEAPARPVTFLKIKWVAPAIVALLVLGGLFLRQRFMVHPQVNHGPVSVLITDFTNNTADPIFDGSLEPILGVALEGASFVSLYNRGQARGVGAQLQPGASVLDDRLGRLVAMREGVSVVVSGSVTREGNMYRVSVNALDAVTGKTIAKDTAKADKKDILLKIGALAASVRTALGDTTPESVQLTASETFSTGSLGAAHEYARAQEMLWAGKWEESIPLYLRAIELDSKLARAYAGIASAEINLGRRQESEKYYQQALAHLDHMTEREKYRTLGGYYTMRHEPRKAIDEYTALLNQYPYDLAGHTNLALNYFYMRDMAKALSEGQRTTTSLMDRANVALYMLYAGDFDAGIKQARAVLKLSPGYVDAYAAVAMGEVGENKVSEAAHTYAEVEKIGPRGASVAAAGLADLALFQGRVADAQNILRRSVPADLARKNEDAASIKLTMLAEADLLAGSKQLALTDAERAMNLNKGARILFSAGRIYTEADQPVKALVPAAQLSSHVESEPQMYGRLLQGEVALYQHDPKQAIALFDAAQSLTDSWLGRFDLGRAYLEAGLYAEADSEFESCLRRRGEVTAVFLDDVPTFRYLPPVYYYLGRVQEGLKSPAAAESYKTFLALRSNSDKDPLVADALRRLASH